MLNSKLMKFLKNQIYKFSNVSKTLKKDSYFTNLIKNKKPDTFIIRRERSILAAMINNLRLLNKMMRP